MINQDFTAEQLAQQADLYRCSRAAIFVADNAVCDNPAVLAAPRAVQVRVAVDAALGYLIGLGLITVKPVDEWPNEFVLEIPPHLRPDVDGYVAGNRELRNALFPNGLPR